MAFNEHSLVPSGIQNSQSSGTTTTDLCMPDTPRTFGAYLTSGQPGDGGGNTTQGTDGHIWAMTWSTASVYGVQLYMDTDPTNYIANRSRSNSGVWQSWKIL
jgi:hypothetical protein